MAITVGKCEHGGEIWVILWGIRSTFFGGRFFKIPLEGI